jgi:acetyl esterase/lipase
VLSRKKKIALGVVTALAVALGGVVVANREKTRLRLAYGPGDVTVTKDIVYVAGSGNAKHRLDVYAPKDAHDAPVVLFVHGGYWTEGDKDFLTFVTGLYGSIGMTLAKRGIVTIVPSYRLSPEVAIEGIVDDVMAALRWTQAHAGEHGGDVRRLFVMGHSAGGYLTALVGTDEALHRSRGMDPRAVSGYVALSAVWEISGMHDTHDAAWNAKVTYPVFGAKREAWAERSPLERLHAGMQPFLIVVGERDFPYMIPQAEKARDRLTDLGAKPRFLVVPGSDHAGIVLRFGAKDDNVSGPIADFVTTTR